LRTNKNKNFKFTIKFLMTLDSSYIGYLGFLGIDLFKSVLMYSNGAICLIKLLFEMGLFTVYIDKSSILLCRSPSLTLIVLYSLLKSQECSRLTNNGAIL
jgi:hypothetical protein